MDVNNAGVRHASRLINSNPRFDAPNDLVERLELQFNVLRERLDGKSDNDVHEFLISSAKDSSFHEIASGGFLYGILTDIPNCKKHFAHFYQYCMFVSDGWYQPLLKMNMILIEIFSKLKTECRQQLLFFFSESIKHNIPKIDNVLSNLFRTTSDGTEYKETCVILQGISEILMANRDWLRSLKPNGTLAPVALLTLSRFISDQHQFNATNNIGFNNVSNGCVNNRFKTAMISLCDFLLKERFSDMLLLGRDLILVLMRLSKISPFVSYWKALLHNPNSLLAKFDGIPQLMTLPCSNTFFNYRVSIHISRKVDFILKMKNLSQTKHLEWFHKMHLNGPDNGNLRSEIMRFVWYNIHLPEYQQQSVIEIRAQFLAWLLKNTRLVADTQWCKLILFWDWFGFDPQVPNSIQLVEPAFSLIRFLVSTAPAQANSLLDYLIRICTTLHPPSTAYFITSITNAFKALAVAGMPVVSVLENSRIDKIIRETLKETFPEIFPKKVTNTQNSINASTTNSGTSSCITGPGTSFNHSSIDLKEPGFIIDFDVIRSQHQTNLSSYNSKTIFINRSDEKFANNTNENSVNITSNKFNQINSENTVKKNVKDLIKHGTSSSSKGKSHVKQKSSSSFEKDDLQGNLPIIFEFEEGNKPLLDFLPIVKDEIRQHLELLNSILTNNITSDDSAIECMQNLIMAIFEEEDNLDNEQLELIAECLLRIFCKYLKRRKFLPNYEITDESLNEIFENVPFFVLFRYLNMTNENDTTKRPLLIILSNMREKCGAIGYLLLYFIRGTRKESADNSTALYAYFELCKYLNNNVESQIANDLEQCSLQDSELFSFLLSFVFDKIANETVGSIEIMHLVCSSIDSRQMNDLIGEIVRENITLFRKDSFSSLIMNSLHWETMEQFILWQLIRAEGVPIEWLMSVIPRLQYSKHSEAISNILLMLKNMNHEPSLVLLKNILLRNFDDLFSVNALKILIEDEDNLNQIAKLLYLLVKKLIESNQIMPQLNCALGKQKMSKKSSITVHNIFSHLDQFRLNCLTKNSKRAKNFLSNQQVQKIFTLTQENFELKSNFSELFAVMEIFSDKVNSNARVLRKNRLRTNDGNENSSNDVKNKKRKIKDDNSDDDD